MDENSGPHRPHLYSADGDKSKASPDWSGETNGNCVEFATAAGGKFDDQHVAADSDSRTLDRLRPPISEPPHDASCRGLSYPDLTPWRVVDAKRDPSLQNGCLSPLA